MKLDQLQYFVVVAETQHIGKASGILNISPSAISHSIRNLEESLGHPLFEKSGKNIYLTEYGKKLSVRARQVLDEVERVKVEFRSPELPLSGMIRVGATHGLGRLVAPAVSRLQEAHPQLMCEFYSLRSAQVLEMTAAGSLDVGVCFSPQAHPNVTILQETKIALKIGVRKSHPLLKAKSGFAEALSKLPSASPKAFAGIEICENHPSLARAGVKQNVKFIFDSYEIAAEYLKATDGWCLMPENCIDLLGLAQLKVSELKATAQIGILSPKGRAVDSRLLESLKSLADYSTSLK
ncbi:MAG: LysR family transcriptional regulator [Bdellovibrionia bacterium]